VTLISASRLKWQRTKKEEKNMKHSKILRSAISVIIIVSIAASMLLLPNTSAHSNPTWNLPTFAFVQVVPNPIGVGQTATVYMWLSNTYDNELVTNNYRFRNYTLTISAPNGTSSTIVFPYVSDTTSNMFYSFTPTTVGTYSFNFTYPGQTLTVDNSLPTSAYINDTYLPSSSTCTCTV
jgi:hypothetical protein